MLNIIKNLGAFSLSDSGSLINSLSQYQPCNYSLDDIKTIHRCNASDPIYLKDIYSNQIFVKLFDFLVYGGDDEFFICDCILNPLDVSDIRFAISGLYVEIEKKDIPKGHKLLSSDFNLANIFSSALLDLPFSTIQSDITLGAFSKGQIVQIKDFSLPFYVLGCSLLQLGLNKFILFYDVFCLDYELVKLGIFNVRRIFVPAGLVRSFKFDKTFYKYVIALYAYIFKSSAVNSLDLSDVVKQIFEYSGEEDLFSLFLRLRNEAVEKQAKSESNEPPIYL